MADCLKDLPPPDDSKQFLALLKKVLEGFKPCGYSNQISETLPSLASIYLNCPAKTPAKRVLASFFQNLEVELQPIVEENICGQLSQRMSLCSDFVEVSSVTHTSHCVDNIAALMENFKLGEHCLTSIALRVIKFLAEAERHFLSQVHDDVPPVYLNEAMQRCHVTVQTLNLVLQKTVVGSADLISQIIADSKLLTFIMDVNLKILRNDLFLLDCRCCCAMNAIVLLQLSLADQDAAQQIPSIILPVSCGYSRHDPCTRWLTPTQAGSLNMETMSTLSYLAMAFGYITAVSPQSIVEGRQEDGFFYLDLFLPNLLSHGIKCADTISRALFGKVVHLWTLKLLNTLQDTVHSESFSAKLHGQSLVLCSLLEYVWTHWDDQLDAVRQSSKSVFENVLKIHSLVISTVSVSDKLDQFMESILTHLFNVSWTSRGKFSALTTSVHLVGAQIIIARRPQLPLEILMQLQEQALSCYASELYTALFTSHRHQLSTGLEQEDNWRSVLLDTWLEPVVHALCSSNKKLKQNIIEYLLSKLMKSDDQLLSHMIQRLSVTISDQHEPFHGAIIMCLRRAQVLGLLRPTLADGCDNLWYGHLHPDVLKAALCSSDEQIRLDAFALLCDNYKTTGIVTAFEFSMLMFFIPWNLNNQSPSFRQSFLSLLNKLFNRLKESLATLKRQAKKDNHSKILKSSLLLYENFLMWLTNHLLENLYPGSAFARRTSSLAAISLISSYFVSEQDGFSMPRKLTRHHIQTLLECLTDTFEENKREALKICTVYLAAGGLIWDQQGMEDLMKVSVILACSTRPQDCSAAVYNFLLMLKQLEYHSDKFNLNKVLSLQVLPSAKWIQMPVEKTHAPLFLLNYLLSLLDTQISVASQCLITAAANRPMYPTLHCIRYVMQELDFKNMSLDFVAATRDFIQHLIVSCLDLARVVSPVVQNSSPEGNIPDSVLGPGLNIGSIPEPGPDKEQDDQQIISQPEMINQSRALVESMPEYLVVCCWRSIKEVSLTLGNMCLQIPASQISESGTGNALLSLSQVQVIGEYFTTQLLESIHRGAFELAYAGFQLMCHMLWNHPVASFHQLPAQWLADVVASIKCNDIDSKLCSTRRSAGVPFFVQAVTSTEPAATGRKCFHSVMKELLVLAISYQEISAMGDAQTTSHAQVHALNILRALFRDARLGEDVVQYVANGLKASILGFKSEQWAVQNSATLLLSALMTRMFGVKRSKEEIMSKKNCQTGRAFFHRYPSLYPFLLSELEEATTDVGSKCRIHLRPSLYPVLLVLGRLFPSTLEGSDTSLNLNAFIPYIIRCAASPVYKTRVIASRALQPLARKNQVISISRQLFDNLPETGSSINVSSSHIHGSLLQLCQLAKLMRGLVSSMQGDILDFFLTNLLQRTWLMSSDNTCFVTRQATLVLVDIVLDIAGLASQKLPEHIKTTDKLREAFLPALLQNTVSSQNQWQPLYFDYERTRARLCLKHLTNFESSAVNCEKLLEGNGLVSLHLMDSCYGLNKSSCLSENISEENCFTSQRLSQNILVKLLESPLYEVRLEVLDVLWTIWKSDPLRISSDCNTSSLDPVALSSGDLETSSVGMDFDRFGLGVGLSETSMERLASGLFDHLLRMAMEAETHHECLQKIFCVLVTIPSSRNLLSQKNYFQILKIFTNLLTKLKTERRAEVKAAMLRFSGHLIPLIYAKMSTPAGECDHSLDALKEWVDLLKSSSASDVDPELQISCCHVLYENARTLLCDPDKKLGNATFDSWDSLSNLLQEDDLEVKDIASFVVCVVRGLATGAYHPGYALHCLPGLLVFIHAGRDLPGVVSCLLQWILYEDDSDTKDSSERLFDKGEMNIYRDQIAFTHSIAQSLAEIFGLDIQDHFSNFVNTVDDNAEIVTNADDQVQAKNGCEENMARCCTDESFRKCVIQTVSSLTNDLHLLLKTCSVTDVYMNSARYTFLCQTVYKAKVVLFLFCREQLYECDDRCRPVFQQLDSIVCRVTSEFHLGNTLTK